MIREYELHDEAYYVVRRADGRPVAVPAWMTCPEAAHAKIVFGNLRLDSVAQSEGREQEAQEWKPDDLSVFLSVNLGQARPR